MRVSLPKPSDRYNRDDERQNRRLIELAFEQIPSAAAAGLSSRRTVTFTTASLAASAVEQGSFDLGAAGVVMRTAASNRACRLRLFATPDAQSEDNTRAYTTAPQAGIGVFLDARWLTVHTKIITPTIDLFNAEDPVSQTIYYTIENLSGSTGTVTITLDVVDDEIL